MSTNPTPTPPNPADPHAYREVLHDLITMGANLARAVHDQATPQPQPATPPSPDTLIHLAAAFDRLARAVRRSITLARTLDHPPVVRPDPAQHRAAARQRILREVGDAITRAAHDPDAWHTDEDALTAELHDRLDGPDLDGAIAARPIPDIITEICRDLGLAAPPGAHPWKRRTPADIQDLCARAAAPARHPAAAPAAGPPRPGPRQLRPNPSPPAPASAPPRRQRRASGPGRVHRPGPATPIRPAGPMAPTPLLTTSHRHPQPHGPPPAAAPP